MKKLFLTLSLSAGLLACGNIKEVRDALRDRAQTIREASLEGSNMALEAYDVAQNDDDAESYLDDDDQGIAGEQAAGAPALSPQGMIGMAPGAPSVPPGFEVVVTRYNCGQIDTNLCRPETVTITGDLKNKRGDIIGSVDATSTFNFHSALTNAVDGSMAGDNNLKVLSRDYVRAVFSVKRTMTLRDGKEATIVTAGHRVFSTIIGQWYVVHTSVETTGFPTRSDGKPAITSVIFERVFAAPDVSNTSGRSLNVVHFADDTTISTVRYATYDKLTDKLTGTWLHQGRQGFEGNGAFDVKINKPFCRLDDVGTVTIDRTFGEAVTRVTAEHVDIALDNTVVTFNGTLTLADGTTRTKSLTRTQVKPSDCTTPTQAREFTVTGTTYRGAEISVDVKRSPGSLSIDGERTMPNGNVQTVHAVRTEGVLNIDISVVDAAGAPVADVHIVVHPDGSGKGEITRYIDGEKVTKTFDIESGRAFLDDGNGKKEEVADQK